MNSSHEHDHCTDCDTGHEHTHSPIDELVTVRDLIRYGVSRFNRAGLYYGHGLEDAFDEAVYLVLHTLHLPLDRLEPFMDACIPFDERAEVMAILDRRADERIPAAYLTHEAWLGDFRFYVDERVIVPRSFCAELMQDAFSPWIKHESDVTHALDLCTGSGCLAILMAHRFPDALIDAVDLSDDALAVAAKNVDDYGLNDQIRLIKSDVFSALGTERYDLIVSNPPYVTSESMQRLPHEYRAEPTMALAAGDDGLDVVRVILHDARKHLTPHGVLVVEVGHNRDLVEAAFPELDFVWLSTETDEDKVFLIRADQLPA